MVDSSDRGERACSSSRRQKCAARCWARLQRRVRAIRCGETFSVRQCLATVCRAVRLVQTDQRRNGGGNTTSSTGVAYEALITEEEQRLLDEFEARNVQRPIWAVMPYCD